MKTLLRMFGLAILGALALAGAARAQISEPGPYYAQPSWDQQLPVSSRFVVLTNWNSAAVLDRETGLVWQQTPDTSVASAAIWGQAQINCALDKTGGRYGWRLPSVEELATLVDPTTGTVFSGAPFTVPLLFTFFWTATTDAIQTSNAFVFHFVASGSSTPFESGLKSDTLNIWCVRGYQGTQSPQ